MGGSQIPFGPKSSLVRSFGRGFVFPWSGAIVDIPATWQLCDGSNGTPDLRNNFVVGAGNVYAIDEIGGSTTHTHPLGGFGHTHSLPSGEDLEGGIGRTNVFDNNTDTGTTNGPDEMLPFYALAYIMQTG